MTHSVDINVDGDNAWPDLVDKEIIEADITHATMLKGGMQSGRYSVAFRIPLPDGTVIISQMSLNMFDSIHAAFQGRVLRDG